jgi:hypothetical protein
MPVDQMAPVPWFDRANGDREEAQLSFHLFVMRLKPGPPEVREPIHIGTDRALVKQTVRRDANVA